MPAHFAPEAVEVPPTPAIALEGTCSWEPAAIAAAMAQAFRTLGAAIPAMDVAVAGPPRAIYHSYDDGQVRWTLAFPIAGAPAAEGPGGVHVAELAGGPSLRFTHTGPYDELAATYGAITEWMIDRGHMSSEADWARFVPMWEEYIDDPESTPPEELRTLIYIPRPGA